MYSPFYQLDMESISVTRYYSLMSKTEGLIVAVLTPLIAIIKYQVNREYSKTIMNRS